MSSELFKPSKTVDLHANAFIKDLDAYDATELFGESLDLLRRSLDAAIYWDYPEIRFIHGKGNGTLREEVYQELRQYKQAGAIASYQPSYQNEDIVIVHIGL